MACFGREEHLSSSDGSDEDPEPQSSSESDGSVQEVSEKTAAALRRRGCPRGLPRAIFTVLALVAVTVCAGAGVLYMPPPQPPSAVGSKYPETLKSTGLSARMLLESPELAEVASQQLLTAGRHVLNVTDALLVRRVTRAGFAHISDMLGKHVSEAAQQLDSFQLTEEQRSAVLGVVRYMGDRRVQDVGIQLTNAIRDFLGTSSTDRKDMEHHIKLAMQPRLRELRRLKDEVIPAPLRGPSSAAGRWGVALDPERMRVVKTFDHTWKFEFDMSRPKRSQGAAPQSRRLAGGGGLSEKRFGVAGGVMEQGRVVLDQLHSVLDKFGIDLQVPGWVTRLDAKDEPFKDLLSCVIDSMGDTATAITCPMRFASAGIDVFSSITEPASSSPRPAAPPPSKDPLWRW